MLARLTLSVPPVTVIAFARLMLMAKPVLALMACEVVMEAWKGPAKVATQTAPAAQAGLVSAVPVPLKKAS